MIACSSASRRLGAPEPAVAAGEAVVRAVLALNRVYLPHRQLKWQRHLIAGLGLVPERLAERLESMSASPPKEGIQTAEALLAEIAALAEAHSGADISGFRQALLERRKAIDPPLPRPDRPTQNTLLRNTLPTWPWTAQIGGGYFAW